MTAPLQGIGHNNGPTMEAGFAWRKHSWARARRDLLPTLPIEVLRKRVSRAKELGLPYKTYASVRAASGHDVIGFLFSNNALRVLSQVGQPPAQRVEKLKSVNAGKAALVHRPVDPEDLRKILEGQGITLDAAAPAPHFADTWSQIAARVMDPVRQANWPREGVLVIGDTTHERDWSEAAKLAGFLPSDMFFAAPS